MASFKSVFLLFSIILVSQTQGANVPLKSDVNILDILKKALYQAEPLVTDVLLAVKQVMNAPNEFDSIQRLLVDQVRSINTNIADSLIEELKIIAKDSTIIGPHLPKCIKSSESNIVGVLAAFTQDYTSCIRESLVLTGSTFETVVNSLLKMHNEDVSIGKGFENCEKFDIPGITCLITVVTSVVDNVNKRVPEIWNDIVPVFPEFLLFGVGAIDCATKTVPTLLSSEKEIIEKIKTCNHA